MAELRAQHVDADAAGRGSVPGESMGSGHGGCRNHPPSKELPSQGVRSVEPGPCSEPPQVQGPVT